MDMPEPYLATDTITFYHGDCTTITPHISDASIDLIVEDWPYFRVKDEWWDRQWDNAEHFLRWIDGLCQERRRILKPNGTLYVFASPQMCNEVQAIVKRHFNSINTVRWYKEDGWHKKARTEDLRTYLKPWEAVIVAEQLEYAASEAGAVDGIRISVFEPIRAYLAGEFRRAGVPFERANEYCGVSSMASRHYFAYSQWRMPTDEHYKSLQVGLNRDGNHGGEYLRRDYEYLRRDYEDLRRPFHVEQGRYSGDLWHYAPVQHFPGKHPTEKPIAMIEDIIKVSSRPGDLVADFFMGRGTTADAVRRTGRHFVGGDIMRKWCKASARRLSQKLLFEAAP